MQKQRTHLKYDENLGLLHFIIFMLFIHIICHLCKESQMIISKYFSLFFFEKKKVTFSSQKRHHSIKLICLHANFVIFTSLTIYHGVKKIYIHGGAAPSLMELELIFCNSNDFLHP